MSDTQTGVRLWSIAVRGAEDLWGDRTFYLRLGVEQQRGVLALEVLYLLNQQDRGMDPARFRELADALTAQVIAWRAS